MLRFAAALLAATTLALTGCGSGSGGARPNEKAELLLDFTPNAVHAGIYSALARGFTGAEGVELTIREPGRSTDSVKGLLSGRADFAIVDIHDLAIAREQGRDLVGVLALLQRPLASVIAQPGVRRPRDLEGRKAGVTGLPSDDAVLDAVVRGDGGDPKRVRRVTIGFNAVANLLSKRVDAVTAFWNAEGVALKEERPGVREFRVDDFGAPSYPELVLSATRETVEERGNLVRAVVNSVARGYQTTLEDPEGSVADLLEAVPDLERDRLLAELDALGPALRAGARRYGELDPARLEEWARWEREVGITKREPDVERAFDGSFLGEPGG